MGSARDVVEDARADARNGACGPCLGREHRARRASRTAAEGSARKRLTEKAAVEARRSSKAFNTDRLYEPQNIVKLGENDVII